MASDEVDEICVIRPAFTVEKICQRYSKTPASPPMTFRDIVCQKAKEQCRCSGQRLLSWLQQRLPILSWLPNYPIKSALLGDFIAGTTVAVMHLPQGMAYALLANLPPVTGLYMAFFPVLLYVLLGTSHHVSMGSLAITCLLMGSVVNELATEPTEPLLGQRQDNISVNDTRTADGEVQYTALEVAAALSLMVGFWEILLGLLQLGALLNVFLSDMLISGFTTGAAIHVMTSQVKYLFGIQITAYNGPLKIIYTYWELFLKIMTANPAAMLISAICIVILVINNELKPKVKKYTSLPIPVELILVILGTVASYYGNLHELHDVRVVGDLPTGLPVPSPPPVSLLPKVLLSGFVVGVIGYTSTFSIAKIFAKRHGYEVDATQELYAHGLSNVFGSFFSCGPIAASLSRSLIQEGVGGFTLLTSFISCCFILLVLLFIGPVFEALPNSVLSSIIVVALKGLLRQVNDLKVLWLSSKADAFIWIATFSVCVIVDLDYGLLTGVLASLLVLIYRGQRASTASLGQVPNTDLYLDLHKYTQAKSIPGIHIFQFGGALHFANVAYFREQLFSKSDFLQTVPPSSQESTKSNNEEGASEERKVSKSRFSLPTSYDNKSLILEAKEVAVEDNKEMENGREDEVRSTEEGLSHALDMDSTIKEVDYIIVDLSRSGFIDTSGCKQLTQLSKDMKDRGITLCISAASDKVLKALDRCETLDALGQDSIFHSTHDAVAILSRKRTRREHQPPSSSYSSNCTKF